MKEEKLDFRTPAELASKLEWIGLALHAKNRISGGESGFLWHLAETIRKAGKLAERSNEARMVELFDNASHEGKIPKDEQEVAFLKILSEQTTER